MLDLVLSGVAIAVSLVVAFSQWYQNKKLNRISIESAFYSKIFMQSLLVDIPSARNKILFTNNKLSSEYRQLAKAFLKLRKNILYFKFRDRVFYDELESQLINLDDYLVVLSSQVVAIGEQPVSMMIIDKKIHDIYDCIFNKYLGKNVEM